MKGTHARGTHQTLVKKETEKEQNIIVFVLLTSSIQFFYQPGIREIRTPLHKYF
jgi:hypothetical protein